MKYTTDWEEIGLSNDFIFGKVMSDPELCKELLERILPGIEIDHIEYPELQKPIKEDVFGKNRHIYTFENICREDPGIKLRDGAIKIFLNAKGNLNDVSSELRAFLDYLGGKKSEVGS